MAAVHNDAEISKIFNRFDANGDGRISIDELRHLMIALSGAGATKPEEIKRMMEEMDVDKDGFVDLKEFAEFHRRQAASSGAEELKAAFDLYDKDKNGVISARELHAVMRKLGEKCSLKDCSKMISSVDVDGDGCVNFEEFKKMMRP
ncbi:unnamed protein product [Rhodiola kirilowii]